MKKTWLIIAHEYSRHALRKRFIFALLSMPALMLVMGLLVYMIVSLQTKTEVIGYVDHSGLMASPLPGGIEVDSEDLIAYTDEQQAKLALDNGEVQAYYVLSADFIETGNARLVAIKSPQSASQAQFSELVRAHLLAAYPDDVVARINDGDNLRLRSSDGSRELGEEDWIMILLPFFMGILFMIAVFTSSGYLMQAVVEEKENRTIEILITSASSQQLMVGKAIGLIAVGLTQLIVWVIMAVVGWAVAAKFIPNLPVIEVPLQTIFWLLVIFIPSFVMISALMIAIGATVTDAREGQQMSALVTLPVVIPYYFSYWIISAPNSPLALALSYFPLTAPIALTMRLAYGSISTWQMLLNLAVLVASALGALWLAGRAFRLGMLSYGKRLTLKSLFRRGKAVEVAQ